MKIEMERKYRTRSGKAVRVLCVDKASMNWPVVVLIMVEDGIEDVHQYNEDGHKNCGLSGHIGDWDLIEIKPSVVFWVNKRTKGPVSVFDHKPEAHFAADCLRDEYEIIARRVELPIEEEKS